VPPTFISPCERFPGLARTVRKENRLPIFRTAPLRSLFLEYDRTTKQITVTGFLGRQVPHKGLPVNCILHFKTMD